MARKLLLYFIIISIFQMTYIYSQANLTTESELTNESTLTNDTSLTNESVRPEFLENIDEDTMETDDNIIFDNYDEVVMKSYDEENITEIHFIGNVEIRFEENTLSAKKVIVTIIEDQVLEISAYESVEFNYDGTIYLCESMNFDPDTQRGVLYGVRSYLESSDVDGGAFSSTAGWYYWAEKATVLSDKKVVLENGYFTTSDEKYPHYSLHAKKLWYFKGDIIYAYAVTYTVAQQDFLWIPFFFQWEKATGIETSFGNSYRLGWYLHNTYEFETDKGDLDVKLDIYEHMGEYMNVKFNNSDDIWLFSSLSFDVEMADDVRVRRYGTHDFSAYNQFIDALGDGTYEVIRQFGWQYTIDATISADDYTLTIDWEDLNDPYFSGKYNTRDTEFDFFDVIQPTKNFRYTFSDDANTKVSSFTRSFSIAAGDFSLSGNWNYQKKVNPDATNKYLNDYYEYYVDSVDIPKVSYSPSAITILDDVNYKTPKDLTLSISNTNFTLDLNEDLQPYLDMFNTTNITLTNFIQTNGTLTNITTDIEDGVTNYVTNYQEGDFTLTNITETNMLRTTLEVESEIIKEDYDDLTIFVSFIDMFNSLDFDDLTWAASDITNSFMSLMKFMQSNHVTNNLPMDDPDDDKFELIAELMEEIRPADEMEEWEVDDADLEMEWDELEIEELKEYFVELIGVNGFDDIDLEEIMTEEVWNILFEFLMEFDWEEFNWEENNNRWIISSLIELFNSLDYTDISFENQLDEDILEVVNVVIDEEFIEYLGFDIEMDEELLTSLYDILNPEDDEVSYTLTTNYFTFYDLDSSLSAAFSLTAMEDFNTNGDPTDDKFYHKESGSMSFNASFLDSLLSLNTSLAFVNEKYISSFTKNSNNYAKLSGSTLDLSAGGDISETLYLFKDKKGEVEIPLTFSHDVSWEIIRTTIQSQPLALGHSTSLGTGFSLLDNNIDFGLSLSHSTTFRLTNEIDMDDMYLNNRKTRSMTITPSLSVFWFDFSVNALTFDLLETKTNALRWDFDEITNRMSPNKPILSVSFNAPDKDDISFIDFEIPDLSITYKYDIMAKSNMSISVSAPYSIANISLPLIYELSSLSISPSLSWDFQNPRNRSFSMAFSFSLFFNENWEMTFSTSVKNDKLYLYDEENREHFVEGETYVNFWEDLGKSLNIFNYEGLKEANFKIQDLSFDLTHYLDEWELSAQINVSREVDNEKQLAYWNPEVKLKFTLAGVDLGEDISEIKQSFAPEEYQTTEF